MDGFASGIMLLLYSIYGDTSESTQTATVVTPSWDEKDGAIFLHSTKDGTFMIFS